MLNTHSAGESRLMAAVSIHTTHTTPARAKKTRVRHEEAIMTVFLRLWSTMLPKKIEVTASAPI